MFKFVAKNSKGTEKVYNISGRHFGLIVGQATIGEIVNKYVEQWGVTPIKVLDAENQEVEVEFKEAAEKATYKLTYQNSKGETKTTNLSGKISGRDITDNNVLKLATKKTTEWGASLVSVENPSGETVVTLNDAINYNIASDTGYVFNHSNGQTHLIDIDGQIEVWIRTLNNKSEIVFTGDPNLVLTDDFISKVSQPGFGKQMVNSVIITETQLPDLTHVKIKDSEIYMSDGVDLTDYGLDFENTRLTTLSPSEMELPLELTL